MPLKTGSSQAAISANIAELVRAGHDQKQAEAIAYKQAGGATTSDSSGRYYTTEKLGPRRELTPEGFLICYDCPIARTGVQVYLDGEIVASEGDEAPLAVNGRIEVSRLPEDVFAPDAMASLEGKPITIMHPDGNQVTPENWAQVAVGQIQNVRRGVGDEADLLIADLVITDATAIEYVNKELPELSGAYDSTFEQIEPGKVRQINIVGNHVALVQRGRAGPRCAVQDHQPQGAANMPNPTKPKPSPLLKRMAAFFKDNAPEIEAEMAETEAATTDEDPGLAAVMGSLNELHAKFDKLLGMEAKEATTTDEAPEATPEEEKKLAGKTGDAAPDLGMIKSKAEILSPGTPLTGDATNIMRTALIRADADVTGLVLGGRTADSLNSSELSMAFSAAAEIKRSRNNARTADAMRQQSLDKVGDAAKIQTVDELNAYAQKRWAAVKTKT